VNLRSQVRFFMHPDDEAAFADFLLLDETIFFVDGPRWPESTPPTTRQIGSLKGNYCIIWSRGDIRRLRAQHYPECNDWYCSSEQATIQFLRSELIAETQITEGRIAVGTPSCGTKSFTLESIARLEGRFRSARSFIRRHYFNEAIQWFSPGAPIAPAAASRSGNPSKPDPQVWVGPVALEWLKSRKRRCFRQFVGGTLKAIPVGAKPSG
jgi:hypothetical protein